MGNNNLLMVNVHIAHDCRVGNHTIFANNAMLAGHVTVGDRAYVSGAVAVHQFCRIGSLAMVGGQAHIVKDVPPYVTIDGLSSYAVGLNQIGLRRAGYGQEDLRRLKEAYRVIYRSELELEPDPGPAPGRVHRRAGRPLLPVPRHHHPRHHLRAPPAAGRDDQAPPRLG